MGDFFEIDFLEVHTKKSGDAIAIRYQCAGETYVHVVDGGYASTGPAIVEHIDEFYDGALYIDHVVVTHPDKDHAEGLMSVLEEKAVGFLWILCPWHYANELIDRFDTYNSVERLRSRLKSLYPYLSALEDLAVAKGIPMREPFQGSQIGAFTVMSPTKEQYLQLVLDADRTPTSSVQAGILAEAMRAALDVARTIGNLVKAAWGAETFSFESLSAENEMSVVQYACLNETKILLTADAGPEGLKTVIRFAPHIGLTLPGIDRFQVPHHGSRRNVRTELLNAILGEPLPEPSPNPTFTAIISAAREDSDHPRKAVTRAMHHRGGRVITTEQGTVCLHSPDAPKREGWRTAMATPYPEEQED